jgi:hypothetical protein
MGYPPWGGRGWFGLNAPTSGLKPAAWGRCGGTEARPFKKVPGSLCSELFAWPKWLIPDKIAAPAPVKSALEGFT